MDIICYACGRGEYPENTLEGIRHCLTVNPKWRIEMDIQITTDDHLVLHHDKSTLRTTGEDHSISQLTLEEVQELNAGYHFCNEDKYPFRESPITIPTLRSVIEAFPQARLLLDIHTSDLKVVPLFVKEIEQHFPQGDFIIASGYDTIIKTIKSLRPDWTYAVPSLEAKKMLYSSFLYLDDLFPIQSDILMLPKKYGRIKVLTKRVIRHAKKRNIPLWAWMYEGEMVKTVTSKADLEKLRKIGVKGVFTGYPKKLSAEL